MATDDLVPQPQWHAQRSRLTWIWPVIIHALLLGSVGFWISGFMAVRNHLPIQFIGSGWWQYGSMALAALLYALMGFSVKLSALATRRMPRILWLPATKLLTFNLEAGGFALFLGYGILSLSIHPSNPSGVLVTGFCVVAIGALITMIKPVRHKLTAVLGSTERGGQPLVSQSVYLSRRAFLSGSVILGMGAAGLVTFWRALPRLIPDYTFFEHISNITSLSWFPDGQHIISTDGKGKDFIWNADDGTILRALAISTTELTKVRLSPNGKFIAASDYDSLYMIDVATGKALWKRPSITPNVHSVGHLIVHI